MANSGVRVIVGDTIADQHDVASTAVDGLYIQDVKVVGSQEPTIAAGTAVDVGAAFAQATVNTAINAQMTRLNLVITALRNHGLIA